MTGSTHRLRGPSKIHFQSILDSGIRLKSPTVSVVARCGVGLVGIATPRSIGCHARRNRQKRRIRECLRNLTPLLAGMDVVVLARACVVTTPSAELAKELSAILTSCRIRLIGESESS